MIKVYFDWNVISQMKNGMFDELKEIVFDNDRLFIPFSTSHISDIYSSFKNTGEQIALINSDLEFISQLTNDICLFIHEKEVFLDYYSPKDLFQERVEENNLDNYPLDGMIKTMTNFLNYLPLDDKAKQALNNLESAEPMKILFPNLENNPTMGGLIEGFYELMNDMNDGEKYKEVRKVIQSGLKINRDKIFDNTAPFQLIDKRYQKVGIDKNLYIDSKYAPEWFNKITNEYILLDMHGYQEDNINTQKGRKETYKNTTEDALHAAFASMCNFYVINDKKSYKKTKMVYEKLDISTMVLKPDEFIDYYKKYLDINNIANNLNLIAAIINSKNCYEESTESGVLQTYIFPFFLFDFFNKIIIFHGTECENPIVFLSKNSSPNFRVYPMEIKRLYKQLYIIFGMDSDGLGEITDEEFIDEEWCGRKWNIENLTYRLIKLNGYFQLYLDM